MFYKYGEVPPNQIAAEKKYFLSAIFKLLPYKEDGYEFLDNYFESVLQQLFGFNRISGFQPEVLTIISLIEYARTENDFDNSYAVEKFAESNTDDITSDTLADSLTVCEPDGFVKEWDINGEKVS